MPRKKDTRPETVLRRVIVGLEDERPERNREAILTLLRDGPLLCDHALRHETQQPNEEMSTTWRAELLAFLRGLVRLEGLQSMQGIGTYGSLNFDGRLAGGHVTLEAAGKDVRDLVVLQLVLLLHAVGLRQVRRCGSGDCQHLFVKTYRRKFCSARCQTRWAKRRKREDIREQERQQQMRTRRRRVAGGQ
jgi:hypothetical protein